MPSSTLLLYCTEEDRVYLPRFKSLVGTASVFILFESSVVTWLEVSSYAKKKGCTGILSTSQKLLQKISDDEKANINDYAGSYFFKSGIEVVFLDPLAQLVSVPHGSFISARYVSKLVYPERWNKYPAFSWELLSPANAESYYQRFQTADYIAVDIETTKTNLAITSISYTAVFLGVGQVPSLVTVVLEVDSEYNLTLMRRFNLLPARKILQNGKYDCSYLLRYNAPLVNWIADTATAFHAWYSELPKDLGYLQAFFLRTGRFWKNMAAGDHYTRLEYNGRDTYATAIIWCEFLLQCPSWAITNYLQEFPLVYPCLLAEMTGIKRDFSKFGVARAQYDAEIVQHSKALDTMLGVTNFNVNSPVQMKALFNNILGCNDLTSRDEKNLAKAAYRHPLISRIVDEVLEIRGLRKLKSTYLRTDADITKTSPGGYKEFHGRILCSLNPHGTDTGRLASKEHHFWCGLQLQNIPRGVSVKQTLAADDGFRIAEVDLEQAESRDTAHIAGDESLIAAVSGSRDFHSVNCSAFFGVPYASIYDDATGKTLNKVLRDTAKRVNHGANYNMGANVLVETMGLKATYSAATALKLSPLLQPKQIAEHLLGCFHKTYPALQKIYYTGVVAEIKTTRMLRSKAVHHSPYHTDGWTRYCFADPEKDKRALNAYVAHAPQSLNAMTLNKAFLKVFYEIALVEKSDFRLLAQIHDSILFQFREGREDLAEKVRQAMEIPVTVTGCDGKSRTFIVPAAVKAGKDGKGSLYWSETE